MTNSSQVVHLLSLLTQLFYIMRQRSVYAMPITVTTTTTASEDTSTTFDLVWSANISSLYPASSPLIVKLGDTLNITCPQVEQATSNIWIQNYIEQYENCDCFAPVNVDDTDRRCTADSTTQHICFDEVQIKITFDSQNLNSALNFQPATTYYLISYSPGAAALDGYSKSTSGGECLQGFKIAFRVQSTDHTVSTPFPVVDSTDEISTNITSTTTMSRDKETNTDIQTSVPGLRSVFLNNGTSSLLIINKIGLIFIYIALCFVSQLSH